MSGGVDSSVAALLLKQQGYSCAGCTMRLYDNQEAGLSSCRTCCSLEDVEDARATAFRLGIPYHVLNLKDDFRSAVMKKFAFCYENGLTPNPCIDCNRHLKFGVLLDRARVLGFHYLATGHYARIEKQAGRYVLKKALDQSKDQSYFLYGMTQNQLAHTLFPLGGLRKSEVREIAQKVGLINAGNGNERFHSRKPGQSPSGDPADRRGRSGPDLLS